MKAVVASAKKFIPRRYRKEYIPGWNEKCEKLYEQFIKDKNSDIARDLLHILNTERIDGQKLWKI